MKLRQIREAQKRKNKNNISQMRERLCRLTYLYADGPDCGLKRAELAQGIGRSRGGRGSKVHAAVDQSSRSLRFEITGAQTHDSKAFGTFTGWQKPPAAIVADKAYGSNAIRQAIANEGAIAVIPSKSNARHPIAHDPDIYAQRNLVERFFCRMKDMRRLTTRYEKLKRNFMSMIHIFAIRCWLN